MLWLKGRGSVIAQRRERNGTEWSRRHALGNEVLVAGEDVIDLRSLGILFVDDSNFLLLPVFIGE